MSLCNFKISFIDFCGSLGGTYVVYNLCLVFEKKSNRIKHECVYYDTKRDMIFLQEWNDRLYIFKPSEIKAITFDSSTNVAMAMVYIDSKVVYVYLGLTTAEEIAKCKQRISEIQDR